MSSWEFFDCLLEKANVVGTPGSGFGSNGEGYFRLTAFNSMEKTSEAALRIEHLAEEITKSPCLKSKQGLFALF